MYAYSGRVCAHLSFICQYTPIRVGHRDFSVRPRLSMNLVYVNVRIFRITRLFIVLLSCAHHWWPFRLHLYASETRKTKSTNFVTDSVSVLCAISFERDHGHARRIVEDIYNHRNEAVAGNSDGTANTNAFQRSQATWNRLELCLQMHESKTTAIR